MVGNFRVDSLRKSSLIAITRADTFVQARVIVIASSDSKSQQLHLLVNKIFFFLRDPEFHLDVSFSVCRANLRFVYGFGNIPAANFTSEASLAVLATITFSLYVNNQYLPISATLPPTLAEVSPQ